LIVDYCILIICLGIEVSIITINIHRIKPSFYRHKKIFFCAGFWDWHCLYINQSYNHGHKIKENGKLHRNIILCITGRMVDARKQLLVKEKELTRLNDALSAKRRRIAMGKIDKTYLFDGPEGKIPFRSLEGRSQLIVQHFMFGPGWKEGCVGCSFTADHMKERSRIFGNMMFHLSPFHAHRLPR